MQNNRENVKYTENKVTCTYFENLHGWRKGDKREQGYHVGWLDISNWITAL